MKQNGGKPRKSILIMVGEIAGVVAIIGLLITVLQLWQSLAESNTQERSQSTLVAISEYQLAAQQTLIALQQNSSSSQQIEDIKATIAALENERLFAQTTLTPGFVVQTITLEPARTVSPTKTFIATEAPTNTSLPSDTPTTPATNTPSLELPFFDNFDQGLRPEWNVTEGQPVITDGWLTASSWPLALEIGYVSDFTLEFDFKSTWRSAEFAGVKLYFSGGIAVVPDYGRINWQAYESGEWNTIVHSDTFVRAPARIQVTRVGSQLTVYRNDQYITDIVYGSGMQGHIRIVIDWNNFFIDNFSLTSP